MLNNLSHLENQVILPKSSTHTPPPFTGDSDDSSPLTWLFPIFFAAFLSFQW